MCNAFPCGTGRYHEVKYPGYTDRQPDSISFANYDQTEFEKFYDEAIEYMITVIIPSLDKAELEQALMEFAA